MAGTWIPIKQYEGFSIYKEETGIATKIKTPQGEFNLTAGQRFHFINPNTHSQNFAFPEVLLKRAESDGEPKAKKVPKLEDMEEAKKPTRETGPLVIGYLIPEPTKKELEENEPLYVLPVFSSEKGDYKKSLVFDTIDDAQAALLKKYGRSR